MFDIYRYFHFITNEQLPLKSSLLQGGLSQYGQNSRIERPCLLHLQAKCKINAFSDRPYIHYFCFSWKKITFFHIHSHKQMQRKSWKFSKKSGYISTQRSFDVALHNDILLFVAILFHDVNVNSYFVKGNISSSKLNCNFVCHHLKM